MQILKISCNDYPLAMYLNVIQKILNLVHLIVPIILIVMVTIQLIKLVISPGDSGEKVLKGIMYQFIAAVVVFFLPFIVNMVIGLVPDSFSLSACWEQAEQIAAHK